MMVRPIIQNACLQNSERTQNIKVINQDNQGAARSRNVGLEAMSDDVEGFLFLDADDEFFT